MIQDIAPHVYQNQFSAAGPVPGDAALVFGPEGLLCRVEDGALVYQAADSTGFLYLTVSDGEKFLPA